MTKKINMAQRYPPGLSPEELPMHSVDGMLLLTAVIGVFVGVALFMLGRKGKQMWMWIWGIALVIFSFYMGVVIYIN